MLAQNEEEAFNVLHTAVWAGNGEVMRILLEAITKLDSNSSVVERIEYKSTLNKLLREVEHRGFTPLAFAVFLYVAGQFAQEAAEQGGETGQEQLLQIIEDLLSYGSDVDAPDNTQKHVFSNLN